MAELTKKPNLEDYLLVEQYGKTGRLKLRALEKILLPISDTGPVEELENEIEEAKYFLSELSASFAAEHSTISELNEKYERKSATDFMLTDPSILKSETILKIINSADLATIDEVDGKYAEDEKLADDSFIDASNKIDKWMY